MRATATYPQVDTPVVSSIALAFDYNPPSMSNRKIVTRFAPSPTGHLHVGGARTALFNWAFARKHGGTFILRIEDTDRARSTAQSTRAIIDDLRWLGLDWDEGPDEKADDPYDPQSQIGEHGPYFQSQRLDLYKEHAQRLMQAGRAYKCFKTPDELKAQRDNAKAEKRPYKYDRTESINLPQPTIDKYVEEGRPHVVRFRMPDHDITVHDLVLGDVTVKASELEDFIILKSDGYPTFHLANVVDDALMQVTHVLRAQEHLMNTPKHVALQEALGFESPKYAHMPLIFNADGSKMSKRDKAKTARAAAKEWMKQNNDNIDRLYHEIKEECAGYLDSIGLTKETLQDFLDKKTDDVLYPQAIARFLHIPLPEIDVNDFRLSGYLPEALLNYLALLGWSPGNDVERFDLDFLKENFDLKRIGKSNARFDRDKLLAFNTEAIAKLSSDEFHQQLIRHDGYSRSCTFQIGLGNRFRPFAACYRERSRTLDEPFANGQFFVTDDTKIEYDPKAIDKALLKNDDQGLAVLNDLQPPLESIPTDKWTASELEKTIKDYAQQKNLGMGKVAQPLRVAVSGSTVSPPIFDTLVILGKGSTLARIGRCLQLNTPQQQTEAS